MLYSNIVPFLGLVAVMLAGAIGYFVNLELERRKTWAFQERTKAYSGFIEAAGAIAMTQKARRNLNAQLDRDDAVEFRDRIREAIFANEAHDLEKSGDLVAAKMRIAVFGTREVVDTLATFWRGGAALETPEDFARFTDLAMIMRTQTVGGRAANRQNVITLLFG